MYVGKEEDGGAEVEVVAVIIADAADNDDEDATAGDDVDATVHVT